MELRYLIYSNRKEERSMKCSYVLDRETNEIGEMKILLDNIEEQSVVLQALVSFKIHKENLLELDVLSEKNKQYEMGLLDKVIEMIDVFDNPEVEVVNRHEKSTL